MCNHYWQLEGQHGKTSTGICKYCDKKRKFLNAFPDTDEINNQFYQNKGVGKRMIIPENNVDDLLMTSKSGLKTQRLLIDSSI
jgi:hypothetical protein